MNNQKRKTLKEVINLLTIAEDKISGVSDREQDSLDNIPENLAKSGLFI